MSKPRRPKGDRPPAAPPAGGSSPVRRSTWEPKPALAPEPVAAAAPARADAPTPAAAPVAVEPVPDPPTPEPPTPEPEGPDAPPVAAGPRLAFAPERLDLAGIGAAVAGYVRGEGEAVAAHIRALSETRSPADAIRLQIREIQRAADASLTCWSTVARKVGRIFAIR